MTTRHLLQLDALLARVETALVAVAGLCVMAMLAVTSVDVVMRYAFNAPLSWSFDLVTQYLLVAAFFLAFPFALGRRDHVGVDFFARMLPARVYHSVLPAGFLAASVLFAAIAWLGMAETVHAWQRDEVVAGVIPWPVWLARLVVPLAAVPFTCRLLYFAVAHWHGRHDVEVQRHLGIVVHDHDL